MSLSVNTPKVHKGWLKKQARSGIIKNWQTRYFVVSGGIVYYYQDKLESPPYGDNLKVVKFAIAF